MTQEGRSNLGCYLQGGWSLETIWGSQICPHTSMSELHEPSNDKSSQIAGILRNRYAANRTGEPRIGKRGGELVMR